MEKFKTIDLEGVNIDDLVDIEDIKINTNLSIEERKKQFIEQVGNPYIFKCNGMVVKNTYSKNGKTLEELVGKLIVLTVIAMLMAEVVNNFGIGANAGW